METLGFNPNTGDLVVRESYPGENAERFRIYTEAKEQFEKEVAEKRKKCEELGHDMRELQPETSICGRCGRLEKAGIYLGQACNDDPRRLFVALAPFDAVLKEPLL